MSDMCGEYNPLSGVPCLRNRGHDGLHWHQSRWGTKAATIDDFRESLRGQGWPEETLERALAKHLALIEAVIQNERQPEV